MANVNRKREIRFLLHMGTTEASPQGRHTKRRGEERGERWRGRKKKERKNHREKKRRGKKAGKAREKRQLLSKKAVRKIKAVMNGQKCVGGDGGEGEDWAGNVLGGCGMASEKRVHRRFKKALCFGMPWC